MTEAQLLANVREACAWLGLRCYHTQDSRRSVAGFPDLVIVGRRVVFRELKVASRTSTKQVEWLAALAAAGADATVWRGDEWPDAIMAELREIAGRR